MLILDFFLRIIYKSRIIGLKVIREIFLELTCVTPGLVWVLQRNQWVKEGGRDKEKEREWTDGHLL